MTTEAPPAALPGTVEWTLVNVRTRESRTYVQSELALDGEARLVGILTRIATLLREGGWSIAELWDLTDETRDVDWAEVGKLIVYVAQHAPELLAELATVFLGVFPTDEDGVPDPDYPGHLKHIRGALNVARFTEMVQHFIAQNDYARMIAPFSESLAGTMAAIGGGSQGDGSAAPPDPSSGPRVVGSDGSVLDLEPEPEAASATAPTPDPKPTSTETSSAS